MTVSELLTELQTLDIKIWAEGDRLRLNAPKGVLTPELTAELSARKAELLTFLQSTHSMAQPAGSLLQSRLKDDVVPLSFPQQRVWFLDQFEPGNVAYNIPLAVRFKGTLDVVALKQALTEIVTRHESLRTTFPMIDGQPAQKIAPLGPLPLPVIDLSGLPESEREAEAQRLKAEEAQRSFDLPQGPVFRTKLLQLAVEEYILLISMHHIVSDGWSLGVLIGELQALYQAFLTGQPSPLTDLPLQYADFAVWQRQQLQGAMLENQLAYWKKQLSGSLPTLDLPLDHPRPAMQTFRGAVQNSVFPPSLRDKLKALSQSEGSTLFMVLLAAFKVLLTRYSGQEDVLVGTPVANRNRVEFEKLIGFFINTLMLRTDLSGGPSFRELIARVREIALEAYAHQDVPFEFLVEALHPARDPSRSPLFQTMFILQNAPVNLIKLPGLTLHPVEDKGGTAKFDLTLTTWEQPPDFGDYPEGLGVSFEYNTDLFEPATIARMISHFRTLLEAIVADPDRPISELPLFSEAERQQLLVDWNATQADYPRRESIHQLFEAQTEHTPEAVALVCGDEHITYQALNRRANQLAHHLQTMDVGPEVFVGVYMERSVEMVVALLAILKAGGAYVPLDPTFPRERLAYMLKDCRAKVLLTQQHLLAEAPEHQAQAVCLDSDWPAIATSDGQNISNVSHPDNLAYVIYTSGSTGRPKGVQIEHRALVNFLTSMGQKPGLTTDDVLLSVTTLSFDIAGLELFLPLLVGARVVIAGSTDAADGAKLLELMTSSGASVMQATPATWQLLLASGWSNDRPIKVLCGGEAMPRELADSLLERSPSVWNLYGPTETTVWSTVHRVTSGSGPVSIGRPIANTQVYILDDDLQPVPVGVTGEFYIGGEGLARGYLNRAGLTAEKFVPDPFSAEPGRRMYRTGDLARYLADGTIDFLGRIDHQVKVRGFRIELGEIEAVLNQQPLIRQAVVVAREDQPGDKRLVAYLIVDQQPAPPVNDLRTALKKTLPDYMIPSNFVFLEAFPLTPNGKINRQALPAVDGARPELEAAYIAPQTDAERTIAGVWQTTLNLEQVGVQDNFFDLGGHSLLIVQVHNQLRQSFSQPLTIADMFRYPTIQSLARYLSHNDNGQSNFAGIKQRAKQRKQRRRIRRKDSHELSR